MKEEVVMVRTSASKSVEFKLFAPQAKKVSIAGSFNKWDTKKLLAKKSSDGSWVAKLSLKPGRYEYKFLVDGNWQNDPCCNNCVPNSFGSHNCVIEIR
jgi:1,4-alpha-glucan branching enzyme